MSDNLKLIHSQLEHIDIETNESIIVNGYYLYRGKEPEERREDFFRTFGESTIKKAFVRFMKENL